MANPWEIEIIGDKQLIKALRDPALINGPLTRFLERASQVVEADAKERAPVDTGRLRSSISRRIEAGQQRAFIGSPVTYAREVEFGRKPGTWPDRDALQGWVRRHGMPSNATFPIARKIFRFGIKPRPYLIPALKDNQGRIEGFLKTMADEVEREFGRRVR